MDLQAWLLFPGQGAQKVGMGASVYAEFEKSKKLFDEAGELLGFDLAKLCFEGPAEDLNRTENAQPALLTTSMAVLEAIKDGGGNLDIQGAMGLSLGEYTALAALGSISFADAVRLVRKRGELMEKAAALSTDTGMSSVMGLEPEKVKKVCEDAGAEGMVVCANFNSPGQVVISGEKKALAKAAELAKEAGAKRVIPLKVSGAFHSPVMEPARKELAEELARIEIVKPSAHFIANARAEKLDDPETIRASLVEQLVSSVRWVECCQEAAKLGMKKAFELGCGKVLAGLMRYNQKDVEVIPVENAEQVRGMQDAPTA